MGTIPAWPCSGEEGRQRVGDATISVQAPPSSPPSEQGLAAAQDSPQGQKSWRPLAALPSTTTQPRVGWAGCWGSAPRGPQNLVP